MSASNPGRFANWRKAFLTSGRQIFLFNWLMLSLVLYSTVVGLGSVIRGYPTLYITTTLAGGVLIGLGLSSKNLWVRLLAGMAALAGLAVAFIYFAGLTDVLLNWAKAGVYALAEIWKQRKAETPPDLTTYYLAVLDLANTAGAIFIRLQAWLRTVTAGQPAYDGLAANLLWSGVSWLLAVWAGWALPALRSPFYSAAPAGILLAVCLNYTSGDARYLLPFLGLLGTWMALYFTIETQEHWQRDKIDYAEDVRVDVGVSASLLMGVLLAVGMMAISIPDIRLEDLTRWLEQVRSTPSGPQADVAISLGLNRPTPQPTQPPPLIPAVLPQEHLLGSGPELSQRLVMTVKVLNQGASGAAARFYWRSQTFDEYTGHGWRTSTLRMEDKVRGSTLGQPEYAGQRLIEQEVRLINRASNSLFATGALYSADHGFTASWRITLGEDPQNPLRDLIGAQIQSSQYRALSYLNTPNEASLKNLSGEIPAWIIQQYTHLPAETPSRVINLAGRLTSQSNNNYERAVAIENYLHSLAYTLDLPAPPADRDVVDYYLFDLERGYCDYAASAMVVMARAVGLPARLVTGYASGKYDAANDRYVVTEADAHSWAEVYLEGVGWVEFEPTGGQPQRQIWAAEIPTISPENESKILQTYDVPQAQILLAFVVCLAVVALLWLGFDRYRLGRLTPNNFAREIYRRYHRPAHQISADNLSPGYTSLELEKAVQNSGEQTVRRLSGRPILARLARWAAYGAAIPLDQLTALYNRATYSPNPLDSSHTLAIQKMWRQLRSRMYLLTRLVKIAGKLGEKNIPPRSETESHDNPREN